ncbi:G2 and S phase-expressed protein 1 isoform X2 [Gouania willdenowi]|uniref:G2 and S phase-expressed protein 1 isoform X2 n=1 Tax=Gouania willdenowi TaxID=441366 RepID=UPI00105668D6|nr:G2 and S phase-expressed protein 1 isoform X2 [Gouania willdenowi]
MGDFMIVCNRAIVTCVTEGRTDFGMDCQSNNSFSFLTDDKFDFDVSLSPSSSSSEEDEVFVDPIGHNERSASTSVASESTGAEERGSWSTLTEDQLDAVCEEALKLAAQLQSSKPQVEETNQPTAETEEFVQDTKAKLDVIINSSRVLSPIRRDTFIVQDSPMKQLPPTIQRQLQKRSFSSTLATTKVSSARLSTSSPMAGSRAPPRMALRGKAAASAGGVLPNRPSVLTGSCSASKNRKDPTRLQPPSKVASAWKRSPSSRVSHREQSSDDLASDSASVASDVSDSSLNCSQLGKRTLPPPTKSVGVRKTSAVKPPSLPNRRNTSSSSSSVSSFNSSLSLSPAKGKLNSSLNQSVIGSTGPTPSSITKPAMRSNVRRSTASTSTRPSTETTVMSTSRRSVSTHTKKLLDAKVTKTTPQKHAEATAVQPTPTKRPFDLSCSIRSSAPGRPQSCVKTKGVSPVLRPKRLASLCSLERLKSTSLPHKPSAGPLTPSASLCKLVQLKVQRPSGLPTPVKRTSAIPSPLSTNLSRTFKQPPVLDPETTYSSARMQILCSPAPLKAQDEEAVDVSDVKPFCLEEEAELPTSPPLHAQEPNQSESRSPVALCQSDSETGKNLQKSPITVEGNTKGQEVLLLDLPAPSLHPQEKLLIDLTNTPDLIRTSTKSFTGNQLIDLSSPLIKWSPEEKGENNAPLINLSF